MQHLPVTHTPEQWDRREQTQVSWFPTLSTFYYPDWREHKWSRAAHHNCNLSGRGTFPTSHKLNQFVFQGQIKCHLLCKVYLVFPGPVEINHSLVYVINSVSPFLDLPINPGFSQSCKDLYHSPLISSSRLEAPWWLGWSFYSAIHTQPPMPCTFACGHKLTSHL